MSPAKPNFLKEALRTSLNAAVIGASSVGCGAAAYTSGEPMFLALIPAIEGLYLAITASLPGFRRKVREKHEAARRQAERTERQKKLDRDLADLSPCQRACFLELKALTDKTLACYARLPSGGMLVASSEVQLRSLLEMFVRLLGALNGYRRYLDNTNRQQIEKELAALRVELASLPDQAERAPLRQLKERRAELLEQRLARFDKALTGRELISHQLAGIEDFIRLLHDQALTLRDPEMATLQIDDLAHQLAVTDETMREMEAFSAVTEEFAQLEPLESIAAIQPVR